MPQPGNSNWQNLGAAGLYGTNTAIGGGGTFSRSELDASRMAVGRTPEATYPDGYLGTINTRRGDRLLDSVKKSINDKSYQRGVHKGERIDPSDYFWPTEMQPDRGLAAEAVGMRAGLLAAPMRDVHLVNDGKAGPQIVGPGQIDPIRSSQLLHLLPAARA